MSCRNRGWTGWRVATWLAAAAIVASTFAAHAELPEWVRNVETSASWHDAVFRTVAPPAGPVEVRRSPADAHDALARIPNSAADAELLAMRARVAEEQLDPAAAEADWTAFAAAATDAAAGQLALADFYHRRLLVQREAEALAVAAAAADPPSDGLKPVTQRRSWRTFERMFDLVRVQQLPDTFAEAQCRAWMARYPQETQPYDRLFRFLLERNRVGDAEAVLVSYQRAFPAGEAWTLRARADLAARQGVPSGAVALYDRAFRPLWEPDNIQAYFELLERTHSLRAFLDRAHADIV